jgi:glycerol-3-phosphate dehydrogenase (NAD(P)+)
VLNSTKKPTIAILGAGSWGTAVALHLSKKGNRVFLWAHNKAHIQAMRDAQENTRYLPNIAFNSLVIPTDSLSECFAAEHIIIAVPSHAFASVIQRLPRLDRIAWLTKGIDPTTHRILSDLVTEKWGEKFPFAIISGPSFATEVALGLPTALTVAGNNVIYQKILQDILHNKNLRVYLNKDYIGVQIAGAVKNVLAIACGISDGLNFGANAKAALITRGLAEMQRLGIAMGAKLETFAGLSGVGDLVLTCTDNLSRNRRFGLLLGQGIETSLAEKEIGQVVEGKYNALQVCHLASQLGIEMPICEQVSALLKGEITPLLAVDTLMNRPPPQ